MSYIAANFETKRTHIIVWTDIGPSGKPVIKVTLEEDKSIPQPDKYLMTLSEIQADQLSERLDNALRKLEEKGA